MTRRLRCLALPPGDLAAQAARLQEELRRRGPCHLLTGSYGGLVALQVVQQAEPEAWLSLAMVGTQLASQPYPRSLRLLTRGLEQLPTPAIARLYRRHLTRSLIRDEVPEATRRAVLQDAPSPGELLERLRATRLPVPLAPSRALWIWGKGDPDRRFQLGDLSRLQPAAQGLEVPGGHRPYASHPAALQAALAAWWEAHESSC